MEILIYFLQQFHDKISDIEVTVNFVERAFNVGTIRFFSGRTETNDGVTSKLYDKWEAIANPYEVFKLEVKVIVQRLFLEQMAN